MRALFDVTALLALFDPDHTFNPRVRTWWSSNQHDGWATCPLTQNGVFRIMSQPSYQRRRPIREAVRILRAGVSQSGHEFWPDDISVADQALFDDSRILGPKQVTDIYILALAVRHDGRLVTFDRGIPLAAVHGAEARHLVML